MFGAWGVVMPHLGESYAHFRFFWKRRVVEVFESYFNWIVDITQDANK